MKLSEPLIASAAVAGILKGSSDPLRPGTLGMCLLSDEEKGQHACKGQNECKGQGGCASGDHGCKGKNSCKGKGGCATRLLVMAIRYA